ncbi:glycosyltransferase family 1 protein [Acidisphaera sp. L21]|uniref:glycosyltransferase family 4 protein n=1 Tax=Acidisphaera sp. L21 TaxID=1641851 RepID=UPI0020B16376|nr:glycosyltransferase family 1 protein [Acidisphaera sp. L21]
MHIAFDGGCFQQDILEEVHHVACGFLNAAKLLQPDLVVTLVCDPRRGQARPEALAGLNWKPPVIYAAVAKACEAPETWPAVTDPNIRFFVDGAIVPAELADGVARYHGAVPRRAFAILSRTAPIHDSRGYIQRRGILIRAITIDDDVRIAGSDRRLGSGFTTTAEAERWTDGAGFIPLEFFQSQSGAITVEVAYTAQNIYPMLSGAGADAVRNARRARRDMEFQLATRALSASLRAAGATVYFTNHFMPQILPNMVNVAWAYDLAADLLPQYFSTDAQFNFQQNLGVFHSAARIYAVSEATRNDLINHAGIQGARVITARMASKTALGPSPGKLAHATLEPLGLTFKRYILVVGTIELRKNPIRILQAYDHLRRRLSNCPELVIVGKHGWDVDPVLAYRSSIGLEPYTKILTDCADDGLASLYSGALFSVYLSVYEGFGLPVLEAMACGCPTLASDRAGIAEIAGGAALLADPYDVQAIAASMYELATDEPLRDTLSGQGLSRAQHYNRTRSVETILDDLGHLVMGRKSQTDAA